MIRRARQTDFSRVCEIYAIARAFMAKTGNATQWGDSFPPEELLREDIRLGRLYVVEEAGNVHGAFAFLLGEDPLWGPYLEDRILRLRKAAAGLARARDEGLAQRREMFLAAAAALSEKKGEWERAHRT